MLHLSLIYSVHGRSCCFFTPTDDFLQLQQTKQLNRKCVDFAFHILRELFGGVHGGTAWMLFPLIHSVNGLSHDSTHNL